MRCLGAMFGIRCYHWISALHILRRGSSIPAPYLLQFSNSNQILYKEVCLTKLLGLLIGSIAIILKPKFSKLYQRCCLNLINNKPCLPRLSNLRSPTCRRTLRLLEYNCGRWYKSRSKPKHIVKIAQPHS